MFSGPGYPFTGLGIVNCLGSTYELALKRLRQGDSGLARRQLFSDFAKTPYDGVVGAVDVESSGGLSPAERPRQALLAKLAARQVAPAVERACRRWGGDRVALVMGTSTGGIAASEKAYGAYRQARAIPQDYSFEKQHAFDGVAQLIMLDLGIGGPVYVVSTACSSSAKALAAGGRLIAAGVCDAVLVGGVDSLCLTTLLGFESLGLVDVAGCRPFAEDRTGITIGEGAAFLLIEREGRPGAMLLSVGESSDAHHMAHPHPEGRGAEQAMRQALELANVSPSDVGYVNAHGTGTQLNDAIEAAAIARVFPAQSLVSSTKAFTGHLLGACGATEVAFCVEALTGKVAWGNGAARTDAGLGIEIVPATATCSTKYVVSNSLAFGGSNASVLLASSEGTKPRDQPGSSSPPQGLSAQLQQATAWTRSSESGRDAPSRQPDGARLLSARTRGRASLLTLMFAELLGRLVDGGFDARKSPVVFGSAYGEMETTMKLLELEAETGQSSPLRFQMSVHNTAAGLLSIATENRGFSTSVAAGTRTFAMALLEGIVYLHHTGESEIAVLVADEPSVSPLSSQRHGPVAAGFHLRARGAASAPHGWTVSAPRRTSAFPETARAELPSEASVSENPVSDSLQLVEAFRARRAGTLVLGGGRAASGSSQGVWAIDLQPSVCP